MEGATEGSAEKKAIYNIYGDVPFVIINRRSRGRASCRRGKPGGKYETKVMMKRFVKRGKHKKLFVNLHFYHRDV